MTPKHDWLATMWSDRGEDEDSRFCALRRQIDTLRDDFNRGDLMKGDFQVRTDVSETDKEVRLAAELPGIQRGDVDVEILGDTITIQGETADETDETHNENGRNFRRIERRAGNFRCAKRLPFEIDPDTVVADIRHGVLTVTVPKPAEMKTPAHKVDVKTAA